ncbi:LysR family transcriptional regulator [Litoreibacter ponti]|uniref:LysR family transcriptional regulator n=1 Tax=Litoreibacter ponti TaxID=1510457 RepID=A0A2T6BHL7_9RHOB|nr:LysR family transcriptional regulator [Litoreibacter ponti]PTX55555.1 LysR family transcriptional regulator [Litoreibacter ponti]
MSYVETIKTFLRVFDLGSMSAAARDQRISPAVASARINTLETQMGVRLFSRTTRSLAPTEQGRVFYDGAQRIVEAIEAAEAAVTDMTRSPRGTLFVAAPLGVGRTVLAPEIPGFKKLYPLVDIRLRLSDRKIDLTAEGLDVVLFQGNPPDSNLMLRRIGEVERVLCASPDYLAFKGQPKDGPDLVAHHDCLNLRYPGAPEFQWPLQTPDGPVRYAVSGPFESDDGDVLTTWALGGYGVVLKPRHEVAEHLASGALVELCTRTPPPPVTLGMLFAHKRHRDPKLRLFLDHMGPRIAQALGL